MRKFLLVYVAFMVAISTIYTITMSIALTCAIFDDLASPQEIYVGRLCIIFASWGADGFMVSGFMRKVL
jgi:hypothetical protein